MDEVIPERTLKLRIRNNIIDYLELAASPAEQRAYECRISMAHVPDELIYRWEDLIPGADWNWYSEPEFSSQEQEALKRFNRIWDSVADATPDPMPSTVNDLLGTAIWQRLIDGASEALNVFKERGRLDEGTPL
ncbi:hypothetical protein [Sphingomonas sp. BK235]|uniref:hypothetical protein n=1 Tax=Sphingomonas sp. BK235 TaxID=2512131 RepID=UPI0010492BBA|nr:hypothetical protein [Sphingomonas sp. BK235]TCP29857.1 hypothetical protein EV292_1154 [Sphingomonas sp. BK235]